MTKLQELCDCGQPGVTHDGSGNPLCKDCVKFDIMAQLRRGEVVTISVKGTHRWTLTPLRDQNGQLAIVFSSDAQTGKLDMATYPAEN